MMVDLIFLSPQATPSVIFSCKLVFPLDLMKR